MVAISMPKGPDIESLESKYIDQITKAYEQGAAAGAKKMREIFAGHPETYKDYVNDAQKKAIFEATEAQRKDLAEQIGSGAHTEWGKDGDPAKGKIDTQAEYDSVVSDTSATIQYLAKDSTEYKTDAQGQTVFDKSGQPVQDEKQAVNTEYASEQADVFAKDVLDGIQVPKEGGQDANKVLGHYGNALSAALNDETAANGAYRTTDPTTGKSATGAPVLAQSTAFSLKQDGGSKGVYALDQGSRNSVEKSFVEGVNQTKDAGMNGTIVKDDTLFALLQRPDVQSLYLSKDQQGLSEQQRFDLTVKEYQQSKEGQALNWKLLGDKGGDKNFLDGEKDPDFLSIGQRMKFSNEAGQTLTLERKKDAVSDPSSAKTADDVIAAHVSGHEKGATAYDAATKDLTKAEKASFDQQLLATDKTDWNTGLYQRMGFSEHAAKQMGRDGDRKDDTGMNDGRAAYTAYKAAGGNLAEFTQYINDVRAGEDGEERLGEVFHGAQGLMDNSNKGKDIKQGNKADDGSNAWDNFWTNAGMDDPDSVVEFVDYLKFNDVKDIPKASEKSKA